MRKVILTSMTLLTAVTMLASSEKNPIKVNQVGYLTHESKIATIDRRQSPKASSSETKRVKPSGAQNMQPPRNPHSQARSARR